MQIIIPSRVKKDLKRLDKAVLKEIQKILYHNVAQSPESGKKLTGHADVLVWKGRILRSDYRIAYRINTEERMIYILLIKSRENFYNELLQRLR